MFAGCGGDGPQSQLGFNPNRAGLANRLGATASPAVEFRWFHDETEVSPGRFEWVTAKCRAPFTFVVAGGYSANAGIVVDTERPNPDASGWLIHAHNSNPKSDAVIAWADCTNV
jgi:hypothetical protein